MAKTNSINLKTKTARKKLPPYREPHWQKFPPEILKGGSLGFRRSPENDSETWYARVYVDGTYHKTNLGGEDKGCRAGAGKSIHAGRCH